jgi:hypothetical protein
MEEGIVTKRAREEFGLDENLNEVSVVDEYLKVRDMVVKNFGERVWFVTDACLSVIATLLLEDITNPTGLNLIGSPSTEKTTILSWFYDIEGITYKTDSFTPASFVSHSSNVKEKDLPKIDLLPRIQFKCIIVPELAPIFQKRKEDLIENISILTRVFDGQGLETDSGARGRRGYKGDYLFAWLGASTPLDFRVWNTMGKLGSRLLFLTILEDNSNVKRVNKALSGLRSQKTYKTKVEECKKAVSGFLLFLWRQTGGVRKVKWDRNGDNEELVECIVTVANLVAKARSVVSVWREKETEYNYNQPIIEHPSRLSNILYNLARGHAITQGRDNLNEDDLKVVIEVGLSSMPDDRRRVLDLLLKKSKDEWTETNEIVEALSICKGTALAIMKIFKVLGLVDYYDPGSQQSHRIKLNADFEWFLTEEFRDLRGNAEDGPF